MELFRTSAELISTSQPLRSPTFATPLPQSHVRVTSTKGTTFVVLSFTLVVETEIERLSLAMGSS